MSLCPLHCVLPVSSSYNMQTANNEHTTGGMERQAWSAPSNEKKNRRSLIRWFASILSLHFKLIVKVKEIFSLVQISRLFQKQKSKTNFMWYASRRLLGLLLPGLGGEPSAKCLNLDTRKCFVHFCKTGKCWLNFANGNGTRDSQISFMFRLGATAKRIKKRFAC